MAETSTPKEQAEKAKDQANKEFKDHKYPLAITGYTRAIELDPENAVYYANRAAAHLRLENIGLAVLDADKSIELNPQYAKGYFRRADAHSAMGKMKQALTDYKRAAKAAPNDTSLRKKLAECEKMVNKMKFEEAITIPDEIPPEKLLVATTIKMPDVEAAYQGPRMQGKRCLLTGSGDNERGYRITQDFIDEMTEAFQKRQKIHRRFALEIIMDVYEKLKALPSLVNVEIPDDEELTVCGDVHGQYYDLLNIFELNGKPSDKNPYLFNGDFVDRGSFSVEVILTLFAYKSLYPNHMHLSRGNHESLGMNKLYGFTGEVTAKFNEKMAQLFREVFCWLPLAHVLNHRVLVVHGGLFSDDSVTLDDIMNIDRFREPPESGPMCELLWSDPHPEKGRLPSKRGVGLGFGPDITTKFLSNNELDLLVRSHEVKQEGYEVMHDGYCITIFSAPKYFDQMDNKGAFIRFRGKDMVPKFTSFEAVPHPEVKAMAYAPSFLHNVLGMG